MGGVYIPYYFCEFGESGCSATNGGNVNEVMNKELI